MATEWLRKAEEEVEVLMVEVTVKSQEDTRRRLRGHFYQCDATSVC